MAKETDPHTYRVSAEVDQELRRLAQVHGGVDKALRVLMGWTSTVAFTNAKPVAVEKVAARPNQSFRAPLLKPNQRGK